MTIKWKTRILELRYRGTEAEDLEFVGLVDMAENNCDFETCKILMKTFVTYQRLWAQSRGRAIASVK